MKLDELAVIIERAPDLERFEAEDYLTVEELGERLGFREPRN